MAEAQNLHVCLIHPDTMPASAAGVELEEAGGCSTPGLSTGEQTEKSDSPLSCDAAATEEARASNVDNKSKRGRRLVEGFTALPVQHLTRTPMLNIQVFYASCPL